LASWRAPSWEEPVSVRGLIIDLDGVLRRWDPTHPAIARIAYAPELLGAAVTGALDDPSWRETIRARVIAEHGPSLAPEVDAWSSAIGCVEGAVLALVEAVRTHHHPVALLTNATTRLEADLVALGLVGVFDAVVSSARIGVAKPAAGAFLHATERLALPPEQLLFVDDTETNVVAAGSLGFRTHLHRSAEELGTFLRDLGLVARGEG
jgi:putative hydrolase of the HAD superfamily